MATRSSKPKAAETSSATDRDYVANWRVDNVDGEVLEPGEIVTLEPDVAAPFVADGCLSEVTAAPSANEAASE